MKQIFKKIIIQNEWKKFKWRFIYSKKKKQKLWDGLKNEDAE